FSSLTRARGITSLLRIVVHVWPTRRGEQCNLLPIDREQLSKCEWSVAMATQSPKVNRSPPIQLANRGFTIARQGALLFKSSEVNKAPRKKSKSTKPLLTEVTEATEQDSGKQECVSC